MNKKLKNSLHSSAGFTLIEIMAVVLIIGLLIATVGGPIGRMLFKGTKTRVEADIKQLTQSIKLYKNEFFRYPDGWDEMMEMEDGGEPYLEMEPMDPWGNVYDYEPPTDRGNFIITSFGADGEPGGEGEDADISNETLREGN